MLFRLGIFAGLRPFKPRELASEIIAGLSLASMDIPQVLGYARIAGMPLVTGLYTAFLPLIAFAALGSSRHLVVAADSATAAIMSGSVSNMAAPGSGKYIAMANMVALLTAGLLLLARLFKLGFLADFLSRTVLTGFLTGVGIQVGIVMLSDMLGLATSSHLTLHQLQDLWFGLPRLNPSTTMLSILVVTAILLGRRFAVRFPVSLLATVGTILASYMFDFSQSGISLLGPVAGGLPSIQWPDVSWSEARALLPVAASCFVMIIAQSAATSRIYAERHHESIDENADILGLAAANMTAALSGTFVVNGSPTQTAMAERSGSRSQVAQLAFAGVVLIVLWTLTGPLQFLPRCTVASIVFTIAIRMIDLQGLRAILQESRGEFALAVFTAFGVVIIGVEQGILMAVALSLLRHVRHSYRPHTMVLAPSPAGQWAPAPATPGLETAPGLIVYRFGADLFYANDNRFADEVRILVQRAPTPVRFFIVDAGAITDIDYSASQSIRDLVADLQRQGVRFIFARVSQYLRADMDRHGVTEVIGEAQIFSTLHMALAAAGCVSPQEAARIEMIQDPTLQDPTLREPMSNDRGDRDLFQK